MGAAALDRLLTRRNLYGFILFSGFCLVCLAAMRDFGTAAIFFVAFLVIAYLRSGDFATLSLICGGVGGSALQLQSVSKVLLKTREVLCTILAERTGRSQKEIYKKTAKDTWFDAQEAVKFGLADRVVTKF